MLAELVSVPSLADPGCGRLCRAVRLEYYCTSVQLWDSEPMLLHLRPNWHTIEAMHRLTGC